MVETCKELLIKRLLIVVDTSFWLCCLISIVWLAASSCRLPTSGVTRLPIPSGSPRLPTAGSSRLPAAASVSLPAATTGCTLPGQQLQVLLQQHGQGLHPRVLQTDPRRRSCLPEGATSAPRQGGPGTRAWGLRREYHFRFTVFIIGDSQLETVSILMFVPLQQLTVCAKEPVYCISTNR